MLPFVPPFPDTLVGLPGASASNAPTNLLEETSVENQENTQISVENQENTQIE